MSGSLVDPHSSENPGTRIFQATSPPLSRNSPHWYLASGTSCLASLGTMRNPGGPRGEPHGLCSGHRELLTRWVGRENDQQGLPNPGLLEFAPVTTPTLLAQVYHLAMAQSIYSLNLLLRQGLSSRRKLHFLQTIRKGLLCLCFFLSCSPSSLTIHSHSPRDAFGRVL